MVSFNRQTDAGYFLHAVQKTNSCILPNKYIFLIAKTPNCHIYQGYRFKTFQNSLYCAIDIELYKTKITMNSSAILQLLQRHDFFQDFIDELPIGIAIIDINLRVITLNRAMTALTGYSESRAKNILCRDIVRARTCIEKCPAANQLINPGSISCETDIINTERQKIPIRLTAASIRGENGEIVGFIEAAEDLRQIKNLEVTKHSAYNFSMIIGKSKEMEKIFNILPVLALSDTSILITGETGTGKDLIAEAVHIASPRSNGPFIKISCGALPESLLESELFGHQRGAFPGAVDNKPGKFRLAHNGTLFLTEIGDLPINLQAKLLAFLDENLIYPLGSPNAFAANVRIVAATNRDLEEMAREGLFRKDLLYRLNVARLDLPSLKDRMGDIRILLEHFRQNFNAEAKKNIRAFSKSAMSFLLSHSYPGNIRELRNITEYAVNICQGSEIEIDHLPTYLTEHKDSFCGSGNETDPPPPSTENTVTIIDQNSSSLDSWKITEKRMILDTLVKTAGRKSKAADILGWSRSTLWRKMREHNIED